MEEELKRKDEELRRKEEEMKKERGKTKDASWLLSKETLLYVPKISPKEESC